MADIYSRKTHTEAAQWRDFPNAGYSAPNSVPLESANFGDIQPGTMLCLHDTSGSEDYDGFAPFCCYELPSDTNVTAQSYLDVDDSRNFYVGRPLAIAILTKADPTFASISDWPVGTATIEIVFGANVTSATVQYAEPASNGLGLDVAESLVDGALTVTITPNRVAADAYDDTADEIATALENLTNVTSATVTGTGSQTPSGAQVPEYSDSTLDTEYNSGLAFREIHDCGAIVSVDHSTGRVTFTNALTLNVAGSEDYILWNPRQVPSVCYVADKLLRTWEVDDDGNVSAKSGMVAQVETSAIVTPDAPSQTNKLRGWSVQVGTFALGGAVGKANVNEWLSVFEGKVGTGKARGMQNFTVGIKSIP